MREGTLNKCSALYLEYAVDLHLNNFLNNNTNSEYLEDFSL